MTYDAITSLLLVSLTLALVSALRRLVPRIDGRALVLVAATVVGVSLSFAARYALPGDALAPWLVAVRGATAAAVAFGVASWPRWAAQVLRDVLAGATVNVIATADLTPEATPEIPPPPKVPT